MILLIEVHLFHCKLRESSPRSDILSSLFIAIVGITGNLHEVMAVYRPVLKETHLCGDRDLSACSQTKVVKALFFIWAGSYWYVCIEYYPKSPLLIYTCTSITTLESFSRGIICHTLSFSAQNVFSPERKPSVLLYFFIKRLS